LLLWITLFSCRLQKPEQQFGLMCIMASLNDHLHGDSMAVSGFTGFGGFTVGWCSCDNSPEERYTYLAVDWYQTTLRTFRETYIFLQCLLQVACFVL